MLLLSSSLLALVSFIFFLIWGMNRKKYHQLVHQIPASVVKNYLDSIIQNSSSLKSSLFRGDLGGPEGAPPSVMPMSSGGGDDAAARQALNQKMAEVSMLQNQLNEKSSMISELESKISQLGSGSEGGDDAAIGALNSQLDALKAENQKLQESLKNAPSGGGGADETVVKERDELKEKLKEYEIIEDDLANLKKLQKENEELKQKLSGGAGAGATAAPIAAAAAVSEAAAAPEAEKQPATPPPAAEAATDAAPPADAAASVAAAQSTDVESPEVEGANQGVPESNKSAEDLLSEFEKMLG